ncbi:MAG: thymidine phosphorylase [Candidatus Poseidoniaceae archaeon]
MHIPNLLAKKRDGHALEQDEIEWFIQHLHEIPNEQIGAFLMACQINGLNSQETTYLTKAMLEQGDRLPHREGAVDKHSTGGVGDKMSLVLAPALRACGATVPMLAGRGLAHTGGTIDKLESIPGFNTGLSLEEMIANPCFISRQTDEIAPTDSILYAIRDVTATVPCIGLITASILSKKAAEGIESLVLDVKYGRAAFMQHSDDARQLAQSMVRVGTELGIQVTAQLTDMDHPIGSMLGNSHEIAESIACLKGKGPTDTMELVHAQANALGFNIGDVIANGSALNEFRLMLIRQGVDESVAQQLINEPWSVLQRSPQQYSIQVERSGYLADLDALVIGQVLCEAGAGRSVQGSDIDHGIGIEIHRSIGERVESGDAIMTLDGPFGIDIHLIQRLKQAITISDYQVKLGTRILETVTISDCPTT